MPTSNCGGASSTTSSRRALDDMSTVQIVGIDDTSLHQGQSDITLVHDLDAKRLLFATEGRDHQTVIDFAADLKAHGGDPAQVRPVGGFAGADLCGQSFREPSGRQSAQRDQPR